MFPFPFVYICIYAFNIDLFCINLHKKAKQKKKKQEILLINVSEYQFIAKETILSYFDLRRKWKGCNIGRWSLMMIISTFCEIIYSFLGENILCVAGAFLPLELEEVELLPWGGGLVGQRAFWMLMLLEFILLKDFWHN